MITFGILIGLTVGIGAAFFLEYTDDSLKIEKDIEKFLSASVVGVIPKIEVEKAILKTLSTDLENGSGNEQTTNPQLSQKRKRRSKRCQKSLANMMGRIIINLDSKSPVTESYRALRTNIQFANADGEVKTILVSSPGPGEGKTLTTSNLAITMARMGTKTLLVDADLKRPKKYLSLATVSPSPSRFSSIKNFAFVPFTSILKTCTPMSIGASGLPMTRFQPAAGLLSLRTPPTLIFTAIKNIHPVWMHICSLHRSKHFIKESEVCKITFYS